MEKDSRILTKMILHAITLPPPLHNEENATVIIDLQWIWWNVHIIVSKDFITSNNYLFSFTCNRTSHLRHLYRNMNRLHHIYAHGWLINLIWNEKCGCEPIYNITQNATYFKCLEISYHFPIPFSPEETFFYYCRS